MNILKLALPTLLILTIGCDSSPVERLKEVERKQDSIIVKIKDIDRKADETIRSFRGLRVQLDSLRNELEELK